MPPSSHPACLPPVPSLANFGRCFPLSPLPPYACYSPSVAVIAPQWLRPLGVSGIAVSSDGRRMVSGSGDSQVRVWDLDPTVHALAPRGGEPADPADGGAGSALVVRPPTPPLPDWKDPARPNGPNLSPWVLSLEDARGSRKRTPHVYTQEGRHTTMAATPYGSFKLFGVGVGVGPEGAPAPALAAPGPALAAPAAPTSAMKVVK